MKTGKIYNFLPYVKRKTNNRTFRSKIPVKMLAYKYALRETSFLLGSQTKLGKHKLKTPSTDYINLI